MESTDVSDHIINNYSEDKITNNNTLDADEKKRLVRKAIESLNPTDGTIVSLYYLEGCSVEEISKVINFTKSNVKVKLHRIRNKIYNQIQHDLNNDLKGVYQ